MPKGYGYGDKGSGNSPSKKSGGGPYFAGGSKAVNSEIEDRAGKGGGDKDHLAGISKVSGQENGTPSDFGNLGSGK